MQPVLRHQSLEKHTYVGVMAAICCVQPVLTDNAGSIHVP
ncbi:hypothetical protein APS_0429 [Acetobacter pasteurianus subsp. pasteurianus LMG 1262 = NBRC 106471]|nr:hypothetical protein APS_0429 [Acetobacter pasteurianus subsp. pasteurianus LMG 1262 = NBRC 106471]